MDFVIHPNVYTTNNRFNGLMSLLEDVWINDVKKYNSLGKGTFYIISGFSNYNGGVRFYDYLKSHIDNGGKCIVIFAGSTSQRLSSKQVVEQLLKVGCEIHIVNRKSLLHAKCYGYSSPQGDSLIVSSGNFTSKGLTQNVEASIRLNYNQTKEMNFSWQNMSQNLLSQNWDYYTPQLNNISNPAWGLLYDEEYRTKKITDEEQSTMLITLSHADTARIQADRGDKSGLGTQYFWLSKSSYDFFPALTKTNTKGYKKTYSAMITIHYIDLDIVKEEMVTFEAENNLDFRLGTGTLRYTKIASQNDLAALTRKSEYEYELRFFKYGLPQYLNLIRYATTFIGNRGKKFGFISNKLFYSTMKKSKT